MATATTSSNNSQASQDMSNTTFPQLVNDTVLQSATDANNDLGRDDEEPAVAVKFERSISPLLSSNRRKGNTYEKEDPCRMHKFTLYETSSRFYLVGADVMDRKHQILKIDRTSDLEEPGLAQDDVIYSKSEMNQLLNAIDDGNKSSGGLQMKCSSWGLLGFIKFTGEYYMLLITKRSQVAMLGGHYIYQVDGTELISLTSTRIKVDRHAEEARYVSILKELDLSRSFYFSYSYDITNTLQKNIINERERLGQLDSTSSGLQYNEMFIWNHYLLKYPVKSLQRPHNWCLPIVHGFVDQATVSVYGRIVYITIIARRSRFFAGARFLKRGANDLGYVANDVETEQIVSEMLTTSFHAPGPQPYTNPNYTSYVQHRGSIPLYWSQDNTGVTPKPDIELNLVDPFYGAAALHFDNLFERYGAPVYVLNLIKARERTPRESKLLREFTNAIQYLNQFLPADKKITYKAWDMSRASKSRDQDVISTLEDIAEDVLKLTGFFHNGDGVHNVDTVQNGVARTNCIDCLDRTNAAQFVIGKLALGHQLHALGVIGNTSVDYDTDAVNLFTHMFHDHGDTIAIQYGGSHLVNTMETYRKINQWSSHSRDMVESFKRYYNNSFLDGQRQEAYNLFLGNFIFTQGQPMLWDLSTDYYLHHADPKGWLDKHKRNYIQWFTKSNLDKTDKLAVLSSKTNKAFEFCNIQNVDDYWLEYYRPLTLSTLSKVFSYRMNSTVRYMPFKITKEGGYDLSPFRIRDRHESAPLENHQTRKGVKIVEPSSATEPTPHDEQSKKVIDGEDGSVTNWLRRQRAQSGILKEPLTKTTQHHNDPNIAGSRQKDKVASTQWTLNEFVRNSLEPTVSFGEMEEYGRYISHPLNLPLVVSTAPTPAPSSEFLNYVRSAETGLLAEVTATEEDIADYANFLEVEEEPLTVTEADLPNKRYKAYRQWLKGKSLFKQSRIDP